MSCPCCNQNVSCCSGAACVTTQPSNCFAANILPAGTPCDWCGTGAALSTCTISVATEFGTAVVSCSSRSATLTKACGTRPSPFAGSTQNVAFVELLPATCSAYRLTTGSRDCNVANDGAAVAAWRANLSVAIRREDGLDGGTTQEIGTYYLLTASGGSVSATVAWSGQLRPPISSGCGVPFNPNQSLPPYITVSGSRCLPCGFNAVSDNRFGCGLRYNNSYEVSPGNVVTAPCCAGLSHTLSIACAP